MEVGANMGESPGLAAGREPHGFCAAAVVARDRIGAPNGWQARDRFGAPNGWQARDKFGVLGRGIEARDKFGVPERGIESRDRFGVLERACEARTGLVFPGTGKMAEPVH